MPVQRQAEPHYLECVRIAARRQRFGRQLEVMYAKLDETCGIEGWTNLRRQAALVATQSRSVSGNSRLGTSWSAVSVAAIGSGRLPVPSLCATTRSLYPELHLSARPQSLCAVPGRRIGLSVASRPILPRMIWLRLRMLRRRGV